MGDAVKPSVAIGFFDGVHLGHQAIIAGADRVITFRNHPLSVIKPQCAPRLITSINERIELIGKPCEIIDFTLEFAGFSPMEFAERYLGDAGEIRCGEDWRFGNGGEGDAKWLMEHGYKVSVVPYAEFEGERISSSRIRKALEEGEIRKVNAMLGRRFTCEGRRFKGKGCGGKMSFPTINLKTEIPLKRGVYAVEAMGKSGVANFGLAPTMGETAWKEPVLEVHFPGATKLDDAGEERVKVKFVDFIREERKFGSIEELKRQIAEDCDKGRI